MEQFMSELMPVLASALGIVITALAAALVKIIQMKAASDKDNQLLQRAALAAKSLGKVTENVTQSLMPEWKRMWIDGKATPEELAKFKAVALDKVRRETNPILIDQSKAVINDFQSYVLTMIDRYLSEHNVEVVEKRT